MPCLGHQPQAHLCDNPKVGLRENPINIRSVAVLKRLPCWIVRAIGTGKSSHSGSNDISGWENDLWMRQLIELTVRMTVDQTSIPQWFAKSSINFSIRS